MQPSEEALIKSEIIRQIQNHNQPHKGVTKQAWVKKQWVSVPVKMNWSKMKQLNLEYLRNIDDRNIEVISSRPWPQLKKLFLGYNQITSLGVAKLLENIWPCLTNLSLRQNQIQNKGMEMLSATKNLPQLQELNVEKNGINKEGLTILPSLNLKLMRLELSENTIGNEGIRLLIKADLPLRRVWIWRCQIGNQGAKLISKAYWPDLEQICTSYNPICYDGLEQIGRSTRWTKTKEMNNCHEHGMNPIQVFFFFATNWGVSAKVYFKLLNQTLQQEFKQLKKTRYDQSLF